MSDNSIVRDGALVADSCSAFEHSALDQSVFYPADMSGLPTSTPNPANLRRKSRRSWFETTPKGFKFDIAVEKPVNSKKPTRKSDTVEVLTLTHFSGAPRLGFGNLKVGQEKTCTLLLRNPHDYEQTVKVEKVPEKKNFSVSCKQFTVGPEESYPLEITWSPKEAGGCREMVMMQVDGAYRVQAYVFGTSTAPPQQKKKGKRVGLLASKAARPFSVIHTTSLANINQQYSPEKKTVKQSAKHTEDKKSSQAFRQPTSRSVKPGTRSNGPAMQTQSKVQKHCTNEFSDKGRKSNEGRRKSQRLSDKHRPSPKESEPTSRRSIGNVENIDPVISTGLQGRAEEKTMTRKSLERKISLPRPKIAENIPRKKMRRSNTYSEVSGLGLVVPIIHGDTVKGLKDTSLLNIEDCNISGVKILEESVRKFEDSYLEPSFLEPEEEPSVCRTLKENVRITNTLEPSFLNDGSVLSNDHNDSVGLRLIETEAETMLKSKVGSETLEPSFLECKVAHVVKNSVFNSVQNCETFHDSLEVENQSVDEPSFLQPENKPDKQRRSLRKRSGIVEIENNAKATGVKLLRGAKRNNARKIISPESFIKGSFSKPESMCESLVDEHKPLNESAGQSTLLDQLKSLKSFVHDKSVEIERSGNESVCDIEDKDSVKELPRRETFVKCRTSPRFSVLGNDNNIRRGTFVAESTKLKLLETQKPSEASPRRTTFTVIKGSAGSKKRIERRIEDGDFALNEDEELDTQTGESYDIQAAIDVNEQVIQNDGNQRQSERLFSADSLENDSFEKQIKSPEHIFVEQKEEWARRATLTVTKSRPSDALLQHAQRSAAALKCLSDSSVVKPPEATIPEDVVRKDSVTEIEEKLSPQKSSQNSTFEVPLENSIVVAKDSSFPTTPYHLLPTSPHLDHSRRSTHVVEKPKVVDLTKVNGKQLFAKQIHMKAESFDEIEVKQKGEGDHVVELNKQEDIELIQDGQSEMVMRNKFETSEEICSETSEICYNRGVSSDLRRRKLSARRSVASLGQQSAEKLHSSPDVSEAELHRNSTGERSSAEKGNKDLVDGKIVVEKQSAVAEQIFFVPFDSKGELDEPARPRTKRPDPQLFLKKRSNPITQEDDRRPKRPKSERTVVKKKEVAVDSGSTRGQTNKVKESAAPAVRVTRQTAKNAGTARNAASHQGLKPTGKVKGLATSKLILTKKSKSAIPKHPLPFAAKNMFYDERWMEKQERGFVNWLNFILTPPEEHQGSDVKVKVDAGKLTLDIEKGRTRLAPTNEILSFRTYSAHRKLNRLRKSACRLFQSESVRLVIQKLEEEVENKRLLVRKDKMLHADVGAKQKVLDMLLSYNPLWLRVGLETVYGEVVPLQCNTDVYGLSQFIVLRVLGSPDIAEEYAHPTVPHLYRDGFAEATSQHTLKRFLMMVYFLDQAKQQMIIDHNPCLFCKNSDIKTSKDMLLQFSRDYLSGEGDITRHLGYLGYKVSYSQTALDEFDFAVKSLGTDLRDGLRLARVMEVICDKAGLTRKSLRAPAISRLQKVHNCEVVFKALEQQSIDTGNVTVRDIVDGHREKTLSLLWTIILHYQVAMVINVEQIKEEVQILERSLRLKKQLHKLVNLESDVTCKRRESDGPDLHTQDERLNLLMKWCRAVCAFYDIKVENFTVSFSDGRALCHILHYYHPGLLPLSQIQHETSMTHLESMEKNCQQNMNCSLNDSVSSSAVFGDMADPAVYEQLLANEKVNFKLLSEKVKELGGIPLMLRWSDMSNTIPDEKVVVTYLMYLCARLLDIRHESRAARVIQHAWRAHRLRKMQTEYKLKVKAVVIIQRAVRSFLQCRREKHQQSAALCIQRVWRGHQARSRIHKLRYERILEQQTQAVRVVQNAVKRYVHRRRYLGLKAAVIQVQAHCRGYLVRRRLHTAATNIQRVYRCYVARKQIQLTRHAAVKIQAGIRAFIARKLFRKQVAAASTIQRRYRTCLGMRRQQCLYQTMKRASIVIQKCWRRHLALKHQKEERAAVKIQACFRCFCDRKRYQRLKGSTVHIQAAVRGHFQYRKYQNLKQSSLLIQKRFRETLVAWQQRKKFNQLKEAAIVIQSAWRMRQKRSVYLKMRSSVTVVQSAVRRMIQRNRYMKLKSAVQTVEKYYYAKVKGESCRRRFLVCKGAAMTIQAAYRGHKVRKALEERYKAAVTIQASYRGYVKRKNFQKLKSATVYCQRRFRSKELARNEQGQYVQIRNAAIAIQAAYKGYVICKQYRMMRQSAIKIEAAVRGYLQRKQYQNILRSLITIQRRMRETRLSRQQRCDFLRLKHAAVVAQSTWKMKREQRRFAITRKAAILIQSRVRGFITQKKYCRLISAVNTIQKYYRARTVGDCCRRQFLISKGAAITIQAWYRGHQIRKHLKLETKSAVLVQSVFRGYRQRRQYLQLKHAAGIAQSTWKMKREQRRYAITRQAAIFIQARVRGFIQHKKYLRSISAVNTIQKYYLARTVGDRCRRQFLITKGAAITIQAWYRGHRIRKHLKLETKSAVLVQSVFRGYRQRRQYLQLKHAAVIAQTTWRMKREERRYAITRQAAILIQARVRGFIQHKKYCRLISAVNTIQKYYLARTVGDRCRRQFFINKGAAITIQAWYRGHQVRKQLKLETKSAVMVQSVFRGYCQRRKFLRLKIAAVVTQSTWRMRREERRYAMIKKAAILIQSRVRGFIQHKKYQRLISAVITIKKYYRARSVGDSYRRQFLISKGAAITIQAWYRGHQIRKHLKLETKSAVLVQSVFRGYRQRRQYLQLKHAAVIAQTTWRMKREERRYAITRQAAILIQARVRGFIQHKKYCRLISAINTIQKYYHARSVGDSCRKQFLITKGAAITIQAWYRGNQVRRQLNLETQSAVVVQSVFRGYSQRRWYMQLKHAAVVCQRRYRAILIGRKLQRQFDCSKKAIIHLQATVRAWKCRREYLRLKSSVVKIQALYRMQMVRRVYKQEKRAAITIQQWFRGALLTTTARRNFLIQRGAAISVQAYFRMYIIRKLYLQTMASRKSTAAVRIQACVRRFLAVQRFDRLKSAAIACQRKYRAKCCGRLDRQYYVELKKSVVTVQSFFRCLQCQRSYRRYKQSAVMIQSWFRGVRVRREYEQQKAAVIVLQTRWRAELVCRQHVMRYSHLRDAAISLQAIYRGNIARNSLRRLKAAVKIQAVYRMTRQRKEYHRMRAATVTIQRVVRSWQAKKCLECLRTDRCRLDSAITIQSWIRTWRARKQLVALKQQKRRAREQYLTQFTEALRVNMAAILIQRYFRNQKMMKVAKERLQSILLIQRWMRSKLQRLHYLRARKCVIRLQSCVRTWLTRRDRAARVIQRVARQWLGSADIRKQNAAAVKIQALWKGYQKRKSIKSRRLTLLRKRVQETSARVSEENKLGNRTSSALDFLLKYKQLSQVLEALQHLEVASRLSWICCERMVEAIPVLYRLVQGCNRSLPHMEIIKYTVNILTNLAKYEKTRPAVYEAVGGVNILVDLMQIYREKGQIFNRTCTLLGILALETPCKTRILEDKKLVERLGSIQTLTARKHKLKENQRVTRERMNATSLNATFMVRTPVKKQKIKPDWSLHKDKMNEIENPLRAINFVLGNLEIQANAR